MIKSIDAKGYLSANNDNDRYGTLYTYDLANRLLRVVDPEIAAYKEPAKYSMKYEYNQFGEKVKAVDAPENTTTYEYDSAGRLIKVANLPEPGVSYGYDKAGNKLHMVDGRGKITRYEYGSFRMLKAVTDADNKTIQYKYNLSGSAATIQDRNGNTTLYTYDNRNLLTQKKVVETGDTVKYSYDEGGNRISMEDESGTSTYSYDKNHRMLEISKDGVKQISYSYDVIGNIETVTDSKDLTTTYAYDKSNRLQAVTFAGKTTTYTYDKNGNREAVEYQGGVKETYTYDKNNRLKALVNKKPDDSVLSTYYDNGLQKTKTDSYGTTTYTYDAAGRVLKVEAPGKTTVYAYDKAGNRLSQNETYTSVQPSGTIDEASGNEIQYILRKSEYVYSNTNRLLKLIEKMFDAANKEVLQKTTVYYYDDNGNELRQNSSYIAPHSIKKSQSTKGSIQGDDMAGSIDTLVERTSNTFDGFNRLKKVENVKSGVRTLAEYTYNGDDLRVKKAVKKSDKDYMEEVTNYLYDRQHVVLETDSSGTVKARYIRGINYIARMDASGKLSYFLYNGHGDVVQTVTEAGEIENQYDYDIWGNATLTVQNYDCGIRYAGEYFDNETGMYYLRARYYDPHIGRFISEDSYWGEDANPLSLNLYTYAHNNPVKYVDPSGHAVTEWDKEHLSNIELLVLEDLTQKWLHYDAKGDQQAKDAIHDLAEVFRNKYRSSNEVGSDSGYTYVVSDSGTSLYHKDAERQSSSSSSAASVQATIQEKVLEEKEKLVPMYSGVDGHMVMVNASDVDKWRDVNWHTTGETILMYSGVDGHPIVVDAADIKQRVTENWITGYQTTTMYSTADGAILQDVYGWQIAGFVNNDEYYTGYQTMKVRSTRGSDKGDEYTVWAWEVWELGQSGGFETSTMQGWREHNEAVEAERQAREARQALLNRPNHISGKWYYENMGMGATSETSVQPNETVAYIDLSDVYKGLAKIFEEDKKIRAQIDSYTVQQTTFALNLQPILAEYTADLTATLRSVASADRVNEILASSSVDASGNSNNGKTYYHVTYPSAAQQITGTGTLGKPENQWESRVFAWTQQPTKSQANAAGIGSKSQVVLQFNTSASFEPDAGITNPKIKDITVQTTDAQRVPIKISNVQEVGFKKEWWQFWK